MIGRRQQHFEQLSEVLCVRRKERNLCESVCALHAEAAQTIRVAYRGFETSIDIICYPNAIAHRRREAKHFLNVDRDTEHVRHTLDERSLAIPSI
jgi:hypothetical protein